MWDEEMGEQTQSYDDNEIWKRWFRLRSGKGGFLSLKPWYEAGKLTVDIGELEGDQLKSSTAVYTSVVALAVYTKAVYDGAAARLYPADSRAGLPAGSYMSYGGSMTDKGPVSRILKITPWVTGESIDDDAFAWKTGAFEATRTGSGAFTPIMAKPLSTNLIRSSRAEMAEIAYRLDVGLRAYANSHPAWAVDFAGKRRLNA